MAADAFARPSSPASFSFNHDVSSPGGQHDMTRLPPENLKSMADMQNEVEVLRKRLKRRNVLLDEVRRRRRHHRHHRELSPRGGPCSRAPRNALLACDASALARVPARVLALSRSGATSVPE